MVVCPRCGSRAAKKYEYDTSLLIACDACWYDESDEVEQDVSERSPTKHRQVYRSGGGGRSRKKSYS